VTHDCPSEISSYLNGYSQETRTSSALHAMLSEHNPDYHENMDRVINGTRFICLAELEWGQKCYLVDWL
jgi:hypothetical protein